MQADISPRHTRILRSWTEESLKKPCLPRQKYQLVSQINFNTKNSRCASRCADKRKRLVTSPA